MDDQRVKSQPLVRTLTIRNRRGLHARAAAKFVKVASSFDAEIRVRRQGMDVCGESIMGLMMLSASPGCTIDIAATGDEAGPALDALEALISGRFDED